jgi:diguanylate cyclase
LGKYVCYGGEDGRFVGVNRIGKDFVELYLRDVGEPRRKVYAITAPGDRANKLRSDNYDPRPASMVRGGS